MRYAMERKDYEELVVLGHGETVMGVKLEDAPADQQRKWLEEQYPKSTAQAVQELPTRGLDATAPVLDYLMKKGEIPTPGGEGRSRKWSKTDIDRAARFMDAEEMYVPGTVARMFYNIDPAQDVRALRMAFRENPAIPPDPSHFVMEIKPGAPGVGVYATVSYRAMTKEEQAAWRRVVAAARKGRE